MLRSVFMFGRIFNGAHARRRQEQLLCVRDTALLA
jgi:hypothetical protein